jgi:glycolate oxidase iron-sulfur subunit
VTASPTTSVGASPAPACALPDSPLAQAAAGLDACVHCGFCLPACPTYVNLQDENDSPRGRLLLMRRLLDGELDVRDPDVGTHMDRCLGCRACETACPSGVPYGQLLEATRATTREARPVPLVARLVLGLFRRQAALSLALLGARLLRATRLPHWLARELPARLAFPLAMLASTTPVRLEKSPARDDGGDGRRDRVRVRVPSPAGARGVALLEGCVMRGLFAHTNAATERVLAATGHSVQRARGQACCGALHAHAGDLDAAREMARRNIAAFERVPDALIAVNSAGCGAMLKEYGHLLHDDPAWHARAQAVASRVRDVSELLADRLEPATHGATRHSALPTTDVTVARITPAATQTPSPVRIAYDPPCHLMHAQRITREPQAVLAAIPGVELVPLVDADQCCGSAGIYNLVEPETSDAVLTPKLRHVADARVEWLVSGNPGCLMQLGAGLMRSGSTTRAVHPIELLDHAIREAPIERVLDRDHA